MQVTVPLWCPHLKHPNQSYGACRTLPAWLIAGQRIPGRFKPDKQTSHSFPERSAFAKPMIDQRRRLPGVAGLARLDPSSVADLLLETAALRA